MFEIYVWKIKVYSDAAFLNQKKLFSINYIDLHKSATDSVLKYSDNLSSIEISCRLANYNINKL